jgi:hypothetical protein
VAGTMPHAIFIETNADGSGAVAAYAAELPGCATYAATDDEAAAALPRRVERFCAWLRDSGERAPSFLGDNWYEVERAAAVADEDGRLRRAAFSLDELPPSDQEFGQWLSWLELAREELAAALDAAGDAVPTETLERIADQDRALAAALGAGQEEASGTDPVDRLYGARDRLTDALVAAGPSAEGVRRAVRLAIADDLRAADSLRGASA